MNSFSVRPGLYIISFCFVCRDRLCMVVLARFVDICPRFDVLEMTVMLSYFLNRWFEFSTSVTHC